MDCDTVLESFESAGCHGRYQPIVFMLISIVCFRNALNPFIVVFLAAEPPFLCRSELTSAAPPANHSLFSANSSQNDGCYSQVQNESVVESTECTNGWNYDESYGSTIVTDWDLVCGRDGLVPLSTSVFMFGVMFGALFVTPAADYFGRKGVMITCVLVQSLLGVVLMFSNGIILFTVLRFLIGALNQGAAISGFVLLTELYSSKNRTRPCIGVNVFWALGIICLGGLAYWIRDWRYLQLTISAPGLIFLLYIWILPNSLPWLLSKNRFRDADQIVQKMARWNKRPIPVSYTNKDRQLEEHNENYLLVEVKSPENDTGSNILGVKKVYNSLVKKCSCLMLFSSKRMAVYTCVVFYLWMVNSLNYYGVSFSIANLAEDRFLDFILSGLVEIPAHIITMFILERFGRRPVLCIFYVMGGISLIISVIIPQFTVRDSRVVLACGLLGKFCVTATLVTVYLYSAEIFPTPVRNSSVGLASFWETIGSVAAPFVIYSEKSLSFLPNTMFGCMSIVAGLCTLLLPETLNQPLPDTVHDVLQLKHKPASRTAPSSHLSTTT